MTVTKTRRPSLLEVRGRSTRQLTESVIATAADPMAAIEDAWGDDKHATSVVRTIFDLCENAQMSCAQRLTAIQEALQAGQSAAKDIYQEKNKNATQKTPPTKSGPLSESFSLQESVDVRILPGGRFVRLPKGTTAASKAANQRTEGATRLINKSRGW